MGANFQMSMPTIPETLIYIVFKKNIAQTPNYSDGNHLKHGNACFFFWVTALREMFLTKNFLTFPPDGRWLIQGRAGFAVRKFPRFPNGGDGIITLKSVICQEGGTFPLVSTWVITCSKAFKKSIRRRFQKFFPTRPKKSPVLLTFKRDIACFNSAIVQGGSVNVGLIMGGAGSPWKKCANIFCKIISMRLICNFIARRPKHDPQHFPRCMPKVL